MNENDMFDIAIVGMAGRFPEARDINQFWQNIKNGKECITFFSDDELRKSGISENSIKDDSYVKASGILQDIEMFDAPFFNITPREAELTDPQHRIFLECVWEALENAGHAPEKYDGIIGVFGGTSMNTYLLNNISKTDAMELAGIYPIMIGNAKDFLCTRVAYKLNLKGPCMTVQSACSTSLVSVHMACQSLLNGECDMAIAGGVAARVPQNAGYKYQDGGILSPDGHCRAFDKDAKGTVAGNGAGVVILKLLRNAIKDKNSIYAVIKGTAVNNDGALKVGFTAPSVEGQAKVIQEALSVANVSADSIGYIETHGTGTQLGDPIEISALSQVFQRSTDKKNFCPIGSVKCNIGHLDVASGVTGLIKTAIMLEKQMIPPSINYKSPNPNLDIENSPFFVNTKLREWKSNEKARRATVSSFGLGGTNACIVLEEALDNGQKKNRVEMIDKNEWSLIPISARTPDSFEKMREKFLNHFKENPEVMIGDVAYTLSMGRREFDYRFYCICKDTDEFVDYMSHSNIDRNNWSKIENKERLTVFLLPELETLDNEAIKDLYNCEKNFRDILEKCFGVIDENLGLLLNDVLFQDGIQERLNEKDKKLIQFSLQYALTAFFLKIGIVANMFAGNEIGAYVTLCVQNKLTLEEAVLSISNDSSNKVVHLLESEGDFIKIESQEDVKKIKTIFNANREKSCSVIVMGSNYLSEELAVKEYSLFYTLNCRKQKISGMAHFLNLVGCLWIKGFSINWNVLNEYSQCKRIHLPTYCFERKKYWIEANPSNLNVSSSVEIECKNKNAEGKKNVVKIEGLKELKSCLKNLLCNSIGVDRVDDNDDICELCGDSFEVLQLNNEIKEQFNLKMPLKNIIENNTVNKLSENMWQLLNDKKISRDITEEALVSFREEGDKTPIFLIHPAGGAVMGYKALVKRISAEHPVYGIQYIYKDEKDDVKTIEEIAQDYNKLVRKIQFNGPVILAGHSFGGNVAFEMAVRLQEAGVCVEDLIMFDSHPPRAYYSNKVFSEAMFLKAFPRVCATYFNKKIEDSSLLEINDLKSVVEYLKSKGCIPWGFDNDQFESFYNLWRCNHNSLRTHMPKKLYTGKFIFFRAQTMQPKEILKELNINLKEGMDMEEWSKLANDKIRLVEVPGTHYTMLDEPNVRVIAEVLNSIL